MASSSKAPSSNISSARASRDRVYRNCTCHAWLEKVNLSLEPGCWECPDLEGDFGTASSWRVAATKIFNWSTLRTSMLAEPRSSSSPVTAQHKFYSAVPYRKLSLLLLLKLTRYEPVSDASNSNASSSLCTRECGTISIMTHEAPMCTSSCTE